MKKTGGRNNSGQDYFRHRGGGHKQYRIIDFKRKKDGIPANGHSHRIRSEPVPPHRPAGVPDGEKRYILAPEGLKAGDCRSERRMPEAEVGNCLPLRQIPPGTEIHNVEMQPGSRRTACAAPPAARP